MKRKIEKCDNFLELIPKKSKIFSWSELEDGNVQILINRDGVLDKIVRLFFKTPEVMRIDLDKYGSCVWKAIDGSRNIEAIGEILRNEFGNEIEPFYERFGTYINILRNNHFITLKK
ncbi:MAG: PqqD family protein [Bacillota bacterium]